MTGWAIHIEEGINGEALACVALFIMLLSAAVGVGYSAMTRDVSSGFAIAGYIATVMGLVITMLYFRWQQV